MSAKILYVEDDRSLAFVTRDNLEQAGFEICHCENGQLGLDSFHTDTFDLCLLDVMLSERDGFSIAEEIRKVDQQIPIIFLTAKSLKEDRIKGFETGGDDYITKPYSIEELILRIRVFLRRSRHYVASQPAYMKLGAYDFDFENLSLNHEGSQQRLTQREAEVLKFFYHRKNQVLKRAEILEGVWGEDDYFLGRSMDVFISKLRKYLKADHRLSIENVHGIGFRFKCP
ncbi:MAG: response regulator transcription factor [Bacteroidota bacterium]